MQSKSSPFPKSRFSLSSDLDSFRFRVKGRMRSEKFKKYSTVRTCLADLMELLPVSGFIFEADRRAGGLNRITRAWTASVRGFKPARRDASPRRYRDERYGFPIMADGFHGNGIPGKIPDRPVVPKIVHQRDTAAFGTVLHQPLGHEERRIRVLRCDREGYEKPCCLEGRETIHNPIWFNTL